LDSLWKRVGQNKASIASMGVVVEDFYLLKTNQHVINEKLYVQRGNDIVWQQIGERVVTRKKKLVQFACLPFTFLGQYHD
jgi:hypothetical protein